MVTRTAHRHVITSTVALAVLTLLALGTTAHAAGWSGWARCELTTQGTDYEQKETHTSFVTDARGDTPKTWGSGSWQSVGTGHWMPPTAPAEWDLGEWHVSCEARLWASILRNRR